MRWEKRKLEHLNHINEVKCKWRQSSWKMENLTAGTVGGGFGGEQNPFSEKSMSLLAIALHKTVSRNHDLLYFCFLQSKVLPALFLACIHYW